MSQLISREEIKQISGRKQKKLVCQQLRNQGIRFTKDRDGWPVLTWESYNRHLCGEPESSNDDGFNLDGV